MNRVLYYLLVFVITSILGFCVFRKEYINKETTKKVFVIKIASFAIIIGVMAISVGSPLYSWLKKAML